MIITFLILGLVLLVAGADLLVRGASRLASSFGVSPLIIGLTIVAFGTSAPELTVSIKAGLSGQSSIAVGNVVGSNIVNILFILGLSALVRELVVAQKLLKLEVPLMILVSSMVLYFSLDGTIVRIEGLILFSIFIIYTLILIYQSKKEGKEVQDEYLNEFEFSGSKEHNTVKNIISIIAGLGLLVIGAKWLVSSAVSIALYFRVSEALIGLTIVAAGTSLPEVFTSVLASLKGERDIAVGNVIGSNLFNILSVLGLSSITAAAGIQVTSAVIGFDLPVMIITAIICYPVFYTRGIMSRLEGGVFFVLYIGYVLFTIYVVTNGIEMPLFSNKTLLTLMILSLCLFLYSITKLISKDLMNRQGN